jgi:hypothetical protein
MPRRGSERPSGRSGKRQSQGHTRARAEAPRVATKGQSRGAQREGIAAQFAERREAEPRTHPSEGRGPDSRVATKGQSRGAQRKCRAKARGRAAQLHTPIVTVERRRDRGSAAPAMTGRTDPRPSVEFEGAADERDRPQLFARAEARHRLQRRPARVPPSREHKLRRSAAPA